MSRDGAKEFDLQAQLAEVLQGKRPLLAELPVSVALPENSGAKIETDRVILAPMTEADAELAVRWRNADRVREACFGQQKLTVESHLNWFRSRRSREDWIFREKASGAGIGILHLKDIDTKNGIAEFGKLVGDAEFLGKGFAKEASYAFLKYAFESLGLRKVFIRTFADNRDNLALNYRLGFRAEGFFLSDTKTDAGARDVVRMCVFPSDEGAR